MTIDGLIVLDGTGRPIIQSAFKGFASSYPLQHVDALNDAFDHNAASTVDSVLFVDSAIGPSVCCHVAHGDIRIACPVSKEVDPLFVFAFIRTFLDVLQDYLGHVTANSIRDNFDTVYQLLEEMLDNGQPVTTELNALRDIITPPTFINKVLSVTGTAGISRTTAAPFSSPIPWRSTGLRYNNNELFFDFVEEMDAIVGNTGSVVTSQVWGKVMCKTRLSGTPDILLTFANSQVLADCSFHPCVRLPRWLKDKAISFVPPDGHFVLMEYRLDAAPGSTNTSFVQSQTPPFLLKHNIEITENGGSLDLTLTPRLSSASAQLENIVVHLQLGDGATSASCLTTGAGAGWVYDSRLRELRWSIKSSATAPSFNLRGTFTSQQNHPRIGRAFTVTFEISQANFSALRIQDLRVTRESYRPFRGVRGRATGHVEVRW